jgi:hypothetical protein
MSSATLLTAAVILTLIAVYQWAARLGVLGAAQMDCDDVLCGRARSGDRTGRGMLAGVAESA